MNDDLQDDVDHIKRIYSHDPEMAHGLQDDLVRRYINERAAADDQDALVIAGLVNDMSVTQWYA
jgi:hypothetical protein